MEAMEGRRQEMDECCTAAADAAGKENMEMCVCACNCAQAATVREKKPWWPREAK